MYTSVITKVKGHHEKLSKLEIRLKDVEDQLQLVVPDSDDSFVIWLALHREFIDIRRRILNIAAGDKKVIFE